jgi:hypothetical protein
MRYRAARPVLRKSDDTHIHRATTLRSQSLATLAVRGRGPLLPACHVSGAVLGRLRSASTVHPASPVVAVLRLALLAPHRLAAGVTPARALHMSIALTGLPVTIRILKACYCTSTSISLRAAFDLGLTTHKYGSLRFSKTQKTSARTSP